ncbi:hypothetical protein VTL71DRAFT_8413 [Oculimacula yallundae]|uniref:Nephrocystin 3-like N-terminal domain-containing protein n=1 Tax=Oculimacula yallundae TaxID=86028 RepID=A0ABR4CXJ2_9HELO
MRSRHAPRESRTVELKTSSLEHPAFTDDVVLQHTSMDYSSYKIAILQSSGGSSYGSYDCCEAISADDRYRIHRPNFIERKSVCSTQRAYHEIPHLGLPASCECEIPILYINGEDVEIGWALDIPTPFQWSDAMEQFCPDDMGWNPYLPLDLPYFCAHSTNEDCARSYDSSTGSASWKPSTRTMGVDSSLHPSQYWTDIDVPYSEYGCHQQWYTEILSTTGTGLWDCHNILKRCASTAHLDFNLAIKQAGTSEWIMRDENMIRWLSHSNGALWLSGKSGAGKSMLVSAVIRDLKAKRDPGEIIAFCFIDEHYQGINVIKAILWAILEPILLRTRLEMVDSYLWTIMHEIAVINDDLSIQMMTDCLCKIRHSLRKNEILYLIVDGLDQVQRGSHEQQLMLHLLDYVTTPDPGYDIRCFVSSSVDFRTRTGKETIRIDLDAHPLLRQDITQYVYESLSESRPLLDHQAIGFLAEQLLDLADGSFLIAKLAINSMQQSSSHEMVSWNLPKNVDFTLSLNDETLSLMCSKALARTDENNQKASCALLRWVAYACEPLGSEALLDAIYRETAILISATDIPMLSAGLLETYGDGVRFVHYSIRRCLSDDSDGTRDKYSAKAHETMGRICIESLSTEDLLLTLDVASQSALEMGRRPKRKGLLRYAKRHWMCHFKQAENSDGSCITGLLHYRLGKALENLPLHSYCPWLRIAGSEIAESTHSSRDSVYIGLVDTLLTVCSRFGFKRMAKLELDMGADANFLANGKAPSPLILAVIKGHSEISRFLLEYGADFNLLSEMGYNALHVAAKYGRSELVSLLLSFGADIDCPSKVGQSALNIAAKRGDFGIIQLLLDSGADINHSPGCGHTSLMLAANHNQIEVARLLLNKGANIDQVSNLGDTALLMAIYRNNTEIFQLLVEYGADVTKCTKRGISPLMTAAKYGHLDIVRSLLDMRADAIDSSDSHRTSIIYAIQNRRFDVMALLLEHDLDQAQKLGRAPHLRASRELYLTARILEPQNTIESFRFSYELTPLKASLRRVKTINVSGNTISKVEGPATSKLLGERRAIVKWFSGDDMYAVLSGVAAHGVEDIRKLLIMAGNDIDTLDGMLSLSSLLSELTIE